MPHPVRSLLVAGALAALAVGAAGCGSSSGSDAGTPSTTKAPATSTTTTTEAATTSTTEAGSTTTAATGDSTTTTYAGTADALPPCQELLQEYTDRFTLDDLDDAAAFFREYAPFMPDDVAAASLRIADAYEAANNNADNLDFGDVDLTADAQTFSDWTNDGCPPG